MKRFVLIMAMVMLVSAVILSGCAQPAPAPKPTPAPAPAPKAPESYVVGVLVPLTGPAGYVGQELLWSAEIARDQINAKGGVDGVPIKLAVGDHGTKPELGIQALRKLAQVDKILMLDASWSSVITACAPVCDELKIMQFNTGGSSPFLLNLGPYSWSVLSATTDEDRLIAQYVVKDLGLKRFGIVWTNDIMGKAHLEVFKKFVPQYGGIIAGDIAVADGQTEFSSEVAKAKGWNADFIFITLPGTHYAWVEKQRDLGMTNIPIGVYASLIGEEPLVKALVSTGITGYCATANISEEKYPNLKIYLDEFSKRRGKPGQLAVGYINSYDIIYIAAEIIKTSKTKGGDYLAGDRLRQALIDKKAFTGGSGIVTDFDLKTGGCNKPMSVLKLDVTGGKYTVKTLAEWTVDEVKKFRE